MSQEDAILHLLSAVLRGEPRADAALEAVPAEQAIPVLLRALQEGSLAPAIRQLAGIALSRQLRKVSSAPPTMTQTVVSILFTTVEEPRGVLQACADCLVTLALLEFETPAREQWKDFISKLALMVGKDPKATMVVRALVPRKEVYTTHPIFTDYFAKAVLTTLLTSNMNLTGVAIVRHALELWPLYARDLAPYVHELLRAVDPTDLQMCYEVLHSSSIVLSSSAAATIAAVGVVKAFQVVGVHAPAGRSSPSVAVQEDGEVYSRERLLQVALAVIAGAIPHEGCAAFILQNPDALRMVLLCMKLTDEDVAEGVWDDCDFSVLVDVPDNPRDAAVWVLKQLMRGEHEGGPKPPSPLYADHIMSAILYTLSLGDPVLAEYALYALQGLVDELQEEEKVVKQLPFDDIYNYAERSEVPLEVRCRAVVSCAALSVFLPSDIHVKLVRLQWAVICDGTIPMKARVAASIGLGQALSHALNKEELSETVGLVPADGMAALIDIVRTDIQGLEALNVVLQVSGNDNPQLTQELLELLWGIMASNSSNTKLCTRIIRLIRQSIVESHGTGNPMMCDIIKLHLERLVHIIDTESGMVLAPPILEVTLSALVRECPCHSITSPALLLYFAQHTWEGKASIRAACRLLSLLTALTSSRGTPPPPEPAEALINFCISFMSQQLDGQTLIDVSITATVAACHLDRPLLPPLLNAAVKASMVKWESAKDWTWVPLVAPVVVAGMRWPDILLANPAFLSVWLTADAVFEPMLKEASTAAACALLTSYPSDQLSFPVHIVPITGVYRRRPLTEAVSIPLTEALLTVVHQGLSPPLSYLRSYIGKFPQCKLVADPAQVEQTSKQLWGQLSPDQQERILSRVRQLHGDSP